MLKRNDQAADVVHAVVQYVRKGPRLRRQGEHRRVFQKQADADGRRQYGDFRAMAKGLIRISISRHVHQFLIGSLLDTAQLFDSLFYLLAHWINQDILFAQRLVLGQRLFEDFGVHALVVLGDAHRHSAVGVERAQSAEVRRQLADVFVAPVQENLSHEVQGLLGGRHDGDVVRGHEAQPLVAVALCEDFTQFGHAFCRAVLAGGGSVRGDHFRADFLQLLQREGFLVGKSSGERDDFRLLGQFQ